jgi:quaternary ammonium compound-resistance protein SugE
MAWLYLLVAGLLECVWALGLKYTHGFTRLVPSVITVVALIASMGLLAHAARTLPIGTAYGVWVGIGAVGAAVGGILLFKEPVTAGRILFLVLLIVAIVGLRFTSSSGAVNSS